MLVPVAWPVANNRFIFKLYDYEGVGKDELVASMKFDMKQVASVDKPTFNWINLYGGPHGCSGDNTDKMNNNPEKASAWKGRILV